MVNGVVTESVIEGKAVVVTLIGNMAFESVAQGTEMMPLCLLRQGDGLKGGKFGIGGKKWANY